MTEKHTGRFIGCLAATADPVAYLDPLQGSSNKGQKARVRQRSLAVPTAAWWTQTKHNVSATEDIKKKKQESALCSAMPAAQKMLHWRRLINDRHLILKTY